MLNLEHVQEYVRELAICLATGGQALMWDLDSKAGRRLTALHDVLCHLCAIKANADFEAHRMFVRNPILPVAERQSAKADNQLDWLELGVSCACAGAAQVCMLTEGCLQQECSSCKQLLC